MLLDTTPRVRELAQRLHGFMEENVYPNERRYFDEAEKLGHRRQQGGAGRDVRRFGAAARRPQVRDLSGARPHQTTTKPVARAVTVPEGGSVEILNSGTAMTMSTC